MFGRFVVAAALAALLVQSAAAQNAPSRVSLKDLHAAPSAASGVEPLSVVDTAFDRATKVEGEVLQVIFRERAVFRLEGQTPILLAAEKGQLAAAHPEGTVTDSFNPPEPGTLAVALDGSAEKAASYLRIWNGLDYPVAYRAILVTFRGGKLVARPAKVCAAPAKGARYEIWPQPVVAVALSKFTRASSAEACG